MGLLRASDDSALSFCNCLYLAVAPDSAQVGIRMSLLTRVVTQSYSHHRCPCGLGLSSCKILSRTRVRNIFRYGLAAQQDIR
jgi:hypothetical protein